MGATAGSGSYVTIEPGVRPAIESRYGCRLLAWSDGPVVWLEHAGADIYGF